MKTQNTNHNVIQGSPEWAALRLGKVTGSTLRNIIDIKKKGQLKSWSTISTQLAIMAAEELTGLSQGDYISDAMQWGIDHEPIVVKKLWQDGISTRPGFVTRLRWPHFGMSPDMLVTDTIAAEIKCPSSKTYCNIVINNEIPADNLVQVLSYFVAMPQVQQVRYVLYDPRVASYPVHIIDVYRNDYTEFIDNIEKSLDEFEDLYSKIIKNFRP